MSAADILGACRYASHRPRGSGFGQYKRSCSQFNGQRYGLARREQRQRRNSAEAAASGDRTALRVTGTYKQKASAFANLIWNAGGLNLTGAQKLLIDVYPEQTLEPRSLNLNISNGSETIYMATLCRCTERYVVNG